MADLRVTELDFEQIKRNLINYLSSQEEFADYNFSGSGLNTIIDLLAYNTHYNAILAHLQSNEMFIDSALKRSSVVSIAKTLGYTPRSVTSSRASLDINVVPSISYVSSTLTIPQYTKFTTTNDGVSYTFVSLEEQTASKNLGEFLFESVVVAEGVVVSQRNTITADTVSGPIKIKNNNIDLSTLNVSVQTSSTNLTTTSYKRTTTIVDVTSTSKVYWVEEGQDGYYNLIFGDDVIGKKLTSGNIVIIEYLASKGAAPNGSRAFTCSINLAGAAPVTTLVSAAAGGADRESTNSIRFNAPKFNATRNRAVTVEDYKSLILANFDKAKAVAVWGGENNAPPIYGKVFISIDPKSGYLVTEADKDYLLNTIIRPRSVLSLLHEFVDPTYLYVGLDVKVNYNPRITPFSSSQVEAIVNNTIEQYFENELSTLDKKFYFARLVNKIQTSHNAILGTLIDMRLQRRVIPILNTHENLKFFFTTSIEPNSFYSTNFTTTVSGTNYTAYVQDFPNTTPPDRNGTGTLKLLNVENDEVLVDNYGTVTYNGSGAIEIPDFFVINVGGSDVRFNALPQELGKDLNPTIIQSTPVSTSAVYPYPSQNIVVTLDDSETNISLGTTVGLKVTATAVES